jgi:hypothetical protein
MATTPENGQGHPVIPDGSKKNIGSVTPSLDNDQNYPAVQDSNRDDIGQMPLPETVKDGHHEHCDEDAAANGTEQNGSKASSGYTAPSFTDKDHDNPGSRDSSTSRKVVRGRGLASLVEDQTKLSQKTQPEVKKKSGRRKSIPVRQFLGFRHRSKSKK